VVLTGSLEKSLKTTAIANTGGESESVAREGNLIYFFYFFWGGGLFSVSVKLPEPFFFCVS